MRRKSGKTLWAKKHSQGQRNELLRLMAFWHLGSGKAGLLKAACPPSAVTTEGDGLTDTKLHFSVLGYPSNPTQFSLGSVSDFMFSWAKLASSTICQTLTHVTTERTSSKRLTQMQTKINISITGAIQLPTTSSAWEHAYRITPTHLCLGWQIEFSPCVISFWNPWDISHVFSGFN